MNWGKYLKSYSFQCLPDERMTCLEWQPLYVFAYGLFRYTIVSTGGTATALEAAGLPVIKVEQLTSLPEMVS